MKKIFSIFAAVLLAGSMFAENYVKTEFVDIQTDDVVIITMQNGNGVYAASNDQATQKAPVATAVTVTADMISTDATNILWTAVKDGSNITFKVGDNALYCTNTNNGVRVGSNDNNVFSINDSYLFNNATNRYVGVYNSQDFRCYTSINSNIKDQTLAFYVLEKAPVTDPVIKAHDINFGTVTVEVGVSFTKTVDLEVIGMNLEDNITYTVSDAQKLVVEGDLSSPGGYVTVHITAPAGEFAETITFSSGNVSKVVNVTGKVVEIIDPTNCAEAAEAALTVSGNNVLYNDGKVYTIRGYVTEIQTAYSAQHSNITFWMADTEDGGKVLEAYRAACASEADAPKVGDLVDVTGQLTKYNSTPEFAAGCTFVIVGGTPVVEVPTVEADPEKIELSAEAFDGNTVALTYANWGEAVPAVTADADAEWISNIALNADNTELTFDVAANDGAARTATITVTATAGETVETATITVAQAKYVAPVTGSHFAKVTATADITDGDYLIVYEGDDSHDAVAFDGSLETLDAVGNSVAVDIAEGKIAATDELAAAMFTLDVTAGTIQSAGGLYIGVSSNSNGLKQSEVADYTHSFSIDADGNAVIAAAFDGSTMTLRYNSASNQIRFRYYKSGQQPVALYKFVKEGTTAIDNTAVETKAVKTLENGILVIEKDGVRYNVLGQAIR